MVETYQKLIKRLNDSGIFPKKHILDNEISKGYKEAIKDNGTTWEMVHIGMHRRNMAKKNTEFQRIFQIYYVWDHRRIFNESVG